MTALDDAALDWKKTIATVPAASRSGIYIRATHDLVRMVGAGIEAGDVSAALADIALVFSFDTHWAHQIVIEEFTKTAKANGKANGTVGAAQHKAAIAAKPLRLGSPLESLDDIPHPRDWITPGLLLRRHVTVLVAPPGVGKSLLTLQLSLMNGAKCPWGGWRPRLAARTLVINVEDDADEMKRRLIAAVRTMNVKCPTENLKLAEDDDDIVIARADSRTKTVSPQHNVIERIIATIIDGKFDVLVVDPFAETFEGDENSNSELKWCAVLWRAIARRTGCAVLLVHHTRKYGAQAGDMDSARGGGALIGVARVVSTLVGMTDNEAKAFGIEADKRHLYLRFDDAKGNVSLVSPHAKWFFKKTYTLPNGSDDLPADDVPVLVPWAPPDTFSRITVQVGNAILDAIDRGVIDEEGEPTGVLFSFTKPHSKRWAGEVVQRFVPCIDNDAQKILGLWKQNGVLEEVEFTMPGGKYRKVTGLRVVPGARLGGVMGREVRDDVPF